MRNQDAPLLSNGGAWPCETASAMRLRCADGVAQYLPAGSWRTRARTRPSLASGHLRKRQFAAALEVVFNETRGLPLAHQTNQSRAWGGAQKRSGLSQWAPLATSARCWPTSLVDWRTGGFRLGVSREAMDASEGLRERPAVLRGIGQTELGPTWLALGVQAARVGRARARRRHQQAPCHMRAHNLAAKFCGRRGLAEAPDYYDPQSATITVATGASRKAGAVASEWR